ncbi:MAG TPA: hypothetical protein VG621_03265 [Candidatus Paceibacterota bacterium]|nr:hypothetical protein [Candidatus Paceibacterota bacterium]
MMRVWEKIYQYAALTTLILTGDVPWAERSAEIIFDACMGKSYPVAMEEAHELVWRKQDDARLKGQEVIALIKRCSEHPRTLVLVTDHREAGAIARSATKLFARGGALPKSFLPGDTLCINCYEKSSKLFT